MEWHEEPRANNEFSLGVLEIIKFEKTEDIVVFGRVKGKIHNGDIVYISNIGDDNYETRVTKILNIEDGPNSITNEASDCLVSIKLENGASYNIKQGTVLHSKDQPYKEKQVSYFNALGDYYISKKKLDLTDEEIDNLTITDCAELWRLFNWYCSKHSEEFSDEEKENNKNKIRKILASLCKKILSVSEIYCLYNKHTDEPHLFSRTSKKENGYLCSPPDILLCSKAYKEMFEAHYPRDKFEMRKIENGEDKKEIYNFLENVFYTNGACGAQVIFDNTAIDASMLVKKPDYSDADPKKIPITNPELVRWMLLLNQNEVAEGEIKDLNHRLYYNFMTRELSNARFLVPMKLDEENVEKNEDGTITIKPGNKMIIPMMTGKDGRQVIPMYTDWYRLRKKYSSEWGSLVQTIEQVIKNQDCLINATDFRNATGYISKEMFEKIKSSN